MRTGCESAQLCANKSPAGSERPPHTDLGDLQIYYTNFPTDGSRVSSSNKVVGNEVC